MINNNENSLAQRVLGAVDLAIDFATLGEYGLEPSAAVEGSRRQRPGPARRQPRRAAVEAPSVTGWEGFATARRGDCPLESAGAARIRIRRLRSLA